MSANFTVSPTNYIQPASALSVLDVINDYCGLVEDIANRCTDPAIRERAKARMEVLRPLMAALDSVLYKPERQAAAGFLTRRDWS